jgi:hypothetical protein
VVINQPAPISCIQVPTFDAMVASHSARNSGICSGLQAVIPGSAIVSLLVGVAATLCFILR